MALFAFAVRGKKLLSARILLPVEMSVYEHPKIFSIWLGRLCLYVADGTVKS